MLTHTIPAVSECGVEVAASRDCDEGADPIRYEIVIIVIITWMDVRMWTVSCRSIASRVCCCCALLVVLLEWSCVLAAIHSVMIALCVPRYALCLDARRSRSHAPSAWTRDGRHDASGRKVSANLHFFEVFRALCQAVVDDEGPSRHVKVPAILQPACTCAPVWLLVQ